MLGDIMTVGSRENHGEWNAAAVHEQVAFGPFFFPDP
jgi:hypothetical protein